MIFPLQPPVSLALGIPSRPCLITHAATGHDSATGCQMEYLEDPLCFLMRKPWVKTMGENHGGFSLANPLIDMPSRAHPSLSRRHLFYIFLELVKNAARASIEHLAERRVDDSWTIL